MGTLHGVRVGGGVGVGRRVFLVRWGGVTCWELPASAAVVRSGSGQGPVLGGRIGQFGMLDGVTLPVDPTHRPVPGLVVEDEPAVRVVGGFIGVAAQCRSSGRGQGHAAVVTHDPGVGAALGPGGGRGIRLRSRSWGGWSGAGVVQGPYEGGPGVGDDLEYRSVGGLGVADGDGAGAIAGDFDALAVAAAVAGLHELEVRTRLHLLADAFDQLDGVGCASPSRAMRSKIALCGRRPSRSPARP